MEVVTEAEAVVELRQGASTCPEVAGAAPALEALQEVSTLKQQLRKAQRAMRRSFRKKTEVEGRSIGAVTAFVDRSFATIAAMFSALLFYALFHYAFLPDEEEIVNTRFQVRLVYALTISIMVPLWGWMFFKIGQSSTSTISKDQVRLVQACHPFLLAWSWKNFVQTSLVYIKQYFTQEFWPEFVYALVFLLLIALVEATDLYKRSFAGLKEGGNSLCARYVILPGQIGLAVGFTWNLVFSWPKNKILDVVTNPLFRIMVQVVYCTLVCGLVTILTVQWEHLGKIIKHQIRRRELAAVDPTTASQGSAQNAAAAPGGGGEEEADTADVGSVESVEFFLANVELATTHILRTAVSFVFGWAMLDTINMFFFNYLMECHGGPMSCSYQSNFSYALLLTMCFGLLASAMPRFSGSDTASSFDKVYSHLFSNSMALNVGWAWMNYCKTAIAAAGALTAEEGLLVRVCWFAFAWFIMSILHHRFHAVKRAWDKAAKDEADDHSLHFV